MRVLFHTSGTTGSGHIVLGLSVANAIRRSRLDCTFAILTVATPFADLARRMGVEVYEQPLEDETGSGRTGNHEAALYNAIADWRPDILITDLFWFALDSFIRDLPCHKILLVRQVDPRFFAFATPHREYRFRPEDWDLILRTEPGFELPFVSIEIPPLIIRNLEEIMSRSHARIDLGLAEEDDACLFAFNGISGEGVQVWKSFSYLQDEGWKVIRSDNRAGGLFPAVDWFNAFDLLVCGAGYSAFWEARYFRKEAFFTPFPRFFEDQAHRVRLFADYEFDENGADRLVALMTGL